MLPKFDNPIRRTFFIFHAVSQGKFVYEQLFRMHLIDLFEANISIMIITTNGTLSNYFDTILNHLTMDIKYCEVRYLKNYTCTYGELFVKNFTELLVLQFAFTIMMVKIIFIYIIIKYVRNFIAVFPRANISSHRVFLCGE